MNCPFGLSYVCRFPPAWASWQAISPVSWRLGSRSTKTVPGTVFRHQPGPRYRDSEDTARWAATAGRRRQGSRPGDFRSGGGLRPGLNMHPLCPWIRRGRDSRRCRRRWRECMHTVICSRWVVSTPVRRLMSATPVRIRCCRPASLRRIDAAWSRVFGLADLLVTQGYQCVASHHQRRGFIGRHRSGLAQRQLQHFGFGSEVVSGGLQEVGMTDLEGEAEERKDVAPARRGRRQDELHAGSAHACVRPGPSRNLHVAGNRCRSAEPRALRRPPAVPFQ